MPDPRPVSSRGLGYLPGVDGLRAVSVVAVLLFHADLTWIPGGFLGVEVFFVISGYLITLLLLKEYETSGRISLKSFWMRRARRLLPALFALLLATTFTVWAFYRDELAALRAQVRAAFTYCTNWYDIFAGHRYFEASGRPPLLQHLWSLAVEEQFYLVWPVLLFVLVRVLRNRRAPLAAVIGLGAVGSAVLMAALYDPINPNRVYLGTDTRASGLLLGATLAVLWRPGRLAKLPPLVADGAVVVGSAGLVVCFLNIHEYDRFLYPRGFLVVSAFTLLVIAGVVHPSARLSHLGLGNSLMTWIGVRSYGLYLWHWPIFVLTRPHIDIPWGTSETLALRLGLTVVATELSYRFIESPIRGGALGRWFAGMRTGDRTRRLHRVQLTFAACLAAAVIIAPTFGESRSTASDVIDARDAGVGDGFETPTGPTAATGEPATTIPSIPSIPSETSSEPDASADPNPAGDPNTSALVTGVIESTAPSSAPRRPPGTVTVLTDSVLLRIKDELTADLQARGWTVDYRGKSALMLNKATELLLQAGTPVGEVVVIGLGYNSLWEHDRVNYDNWAARFDREADELLSALTSLGAKHFVWVTLREPDRDIIPKSSANEYKQYAWFFPYANERIRLIDERRDDVVLADWAAISNISGISGDLIHLNAKGYALMSDLIFRTGGF